MNKKLLLFFAILGIATSSFAQRSLPIIKANSLKVDIRDGNIFTKERWRIVPEVKPDILTTKNTKVTFYTDIDSITVKVKPNERFNFVILVNGKDSALTQVYCVDYLLTLKNASKYNIKEKRELPQFTYQSETDSNLVALRKKYNLDSIGGKGNEISQIINLCHWLHNLVPHDGQHGINSDRNAVSIISTCQQKKIGTNCRGLAITLNECYLAMGFKSRYVTCLPKDSLDQDCHVINSVYSKTMNKWIWIDPSFDAYVMNEKGELLSIEEVRERLITNKPLILNPDANWNHKESATKEHYLYYYMAKNLYILQSPSSSEFDLETYKKDKKIALISLLPLDYYRQNPYNVGKFWRTNNPTVFWVKP